MSHEAVEPGQRAFVARDVADEERTWRARLPAMLEQLAARWQLALGPELHGGLLSCTREVVCADGSEAVLKLGAWPRARDEIAALAAWRGRGAPSLIAADVELRALLLERVRPGTHVEGADGEAVAEVLGLLHVEPPDGLPSLAQIVRRRIDAAVRGGRASARKAAWAQATVEELERGAPPPVLLHGALDERNLLVCARRGLCAIGPLPCAGDPAYDAGYWVHGNRRPGRRARLDAILGATGLPRERVRDWAAVVGVHG